jgi:putative oxidoreductase
MSNEYMKNEYMKIEKPGIFSFFDVLQPIADLLLRVWVAWAFYTSGLTKVTTHSLFTFFNKNFGYPTSLAPTDLTISLFKDEYQVPLLSPELAAQMGTAAEIILPLFIIFGLFGRLAALGLFIFNITAVLSYPAAQAGFALEQHILWGLMLLIVVAHGPGKLSLDNLFNQMRQKE